MNKFTCKPVVLSSLLTTYILILSLFSVFAQESSYWQKAGSLIKSENYKEAIKEIDELLINKPNDILLLRLKGVCFIKLGESDKAVNILQKALKANPENVAVRFYLAKAFAYQGKVSQSIDLLCFVIEKAPDSSYAGIAKELIPKLKATANITHPIDATKRWNLYLSLAEEYDDNVSATAREDDGVVTDSFRTVTSGAFEYRFIDQDVDESDFTLGTRHSMYYSWHGKNKFTSYNLGINSSDIFLDKNGMVWDKPYTLRFEGNYTNTWLGDKHFSDAAGVSSSAWIEWSPKSTVVPRYRAVWQDYKDDTSDPGKYSRDSWTHYIGLDHYLQLCNDNLLWGLGYEYRIVNADGTQFDRNSYNVFTSLSLALPKDMGLSTRIDYTNDDYVKYDPEPKRSDDIITVSTILTYPLSKDELYLKAGHTFLRSYSENNFSDYRRNVVSLAVEFYM